MALELNLAGSEKVGGKEIGSDLKTKSFKSSQLAFPIPSRRNLQSHFS